MGTHVPCERCSGNSRDPDLEGQTWARTNMSFPTAMDGPSGAKATSEPPASTDTQSQAMDVARHIATNQRSEVLIHGRNGQIRERNSYGNDPCPPRGHPISKQIAEHRAGFRASS